MSDSAHQAFDRCPNRKASIDSTPTRLLQPANVIVTCPRYPDGTAFVNENQFDNPAYRQKAALRLGCIGCKYSKENYREVDAREKLETLHPEIAELCGGLFAAEYYPEAALKGFKIVKDKLRDLTGYERATDAFGRGGLYIQGSAAEHVDDDFQKAAQFLMMAIDNFRNEGSHTSFGNISGSERAYEYLNLSSLAMNLLDSATVKD